MSSAEEIPGGSTEPDVSWVQWYIKKGGGEKKKCEMSSQRLQFQGMHISGDH